MLFLKMRNIGTIQNDKHHLKMNYTHDKLYTNRNFTLSFPMYIRHIPIWRPAYLKVIRPPRPKIPNRHFSFLLITVNNLTLFHIFMHRITDRVIPKDQCSFRAVKCNRYSPAFCTFDLVLVPCSIKFCLFLTGFNFRY